MYFEKKMYYRLCPNTKWLDESFNFPYVPYTIVGAIMMDTFEVSRKEYDTFKVKVGEFFMIESEFVFGKERNAITHNGTKHLVHITKEFLVMNSETFKDITKQIERDNTIKEILE